MKRILLIGLLAMMIFVIGCAQPQYVCADGTTVDDPSKCGDDEAEPTPTTVVKKKATPEPTEAPESTKVTTKVTIPSEPEIPDEIQKILDRSGTVKSLSYDFKRVHKTKEQDYETWVKGNAVKQEQEIVEGILHQNEVDVVIFDVEKETAVAYCESEKYCKVTGKYDNVDFDAYYVETPFDWVKKINKAEKVGSERMFNRDTWKLDVNDGEMTIWVENYYGVPLRVDVGSASYEFRNPVFNAVKSSEVEFNVKKDLE